MSSRGSTKVSHEKIQSVKNLIEECLKHYMSQKEVVDALSHRANIEPIFTELVWKKLEEENQEFFKAYHLRLMLKEQILLFNRLLERQIEASDQMCPSGVGYVPLSNKFQISPMNENSLCNALQPTGEYLKPDNMQRPTVVGFCDTFTNDGSPQQPCMQNEVDRPSHARGVNVPSNMLLAQNYNVEMMHRVNGGMNKLQAHYIDNSQLMFGTDANVLDTHPSTGDASVSSFSSLESNSQPLNETVLDTHNSSFGLLGQIPQSFSLSDLNADFSNGSDILESYPTSPFLATDTESFLDPHVVGENQGLTASHWDSFLK